MVDYPEPRLRFVFQADVDLGPIQELGTVDGLRSRIVPIVGGLVAGPRLNGRIMSGGADWQTVRPGDGLTRVKARYWIEANDGTMIGVDNPGIRRAPAEVTARLLAGEVVAPDSYYFRTMPRFDVGADAHRWLNETVFVGVGARQPDRAIIRFYAVD